MSVGLGPSIDYEVSQVYYECGLSRTDLVFYHRSGQMGLPWIWLVLFISFLSSNIDQMLCR